MAKFTVGKPEARTDGKVACDIFVLNNADEVIGHFTVILEADAVNAVKGSKAERVALYKSLFSADPRIARTVDSEAAVAKMEADIDFPVTVDLQ